MENYGEIGKVSVNLYKIMGGFAPDNRIFGRKNESLCKRTGPRHF